MMMSMVKQKEIKNSRHGGKYIYVYLDINKVFQMLIGKLVSLLSHLI